MKLALFRVWLPEVDRRGRRRQRICSWRLVEAVDETSARRQAPKATRIDRIYDAAHPRDEEQAA